MSFAVEAGETYLRYEEGEVIGWPADAVTDAELALRELRRNGGIMATPTGPTYEADDSRGALLALLSVVDGPVELHGAPVLPVQQDELEFLVRAVQEAYVEEQHPRDILGRWRNKFVLVPLGVPGSGKGTIGKLLAKEYGVPHVSTGDMLRALPKDSELGQQVWPLIEQGEYVPDHLVNEMVADRLSKPDAAEGIVLDGYPRTLGQVDFLDQGGAPVKFIELALPKEVAISRLLKRAEIEGRSDDTPEVIANRFKVYDRESQPMVDKLDADGRVVRVEVADAGPEVNAAAAKAALAPPMSGGYYDKKPLGHYKAKLAVVGSDATGWLVVGAHHAHLPFDEAEMLSLNYEPLATKAEARKELTAIAREEKLGKEGRYNFGPGSRG